MNPSSPTCQVLDLELESRHEQIIQIGALKYQGSHQLEQQRFKSPFALQDYALNVDYIVGHNLLAHDLRVLEKLERPFFQPQVAFIDTLY